MCLKIGFLANLSVVYYHKHSIQNGLKSVADAFLPNFVISFTVLTMFATVCGFVLLQNRKKGEFIDWVKQNVFENNPNLLVLGEK